MRSPERRAAFALVPALAIALAIGGAVAAQPRGGGASDAPAADAPDAAHAPLIAAVDAQRAVVDGARAMVVDKLDERRRQQVVHLRAAYKALRDRAAPLPGATDDRLAGAWRRVAARRILALDAGEVAQLAGELDDIDAAGRRLDADRETAATLALPTPALLRPVDGELVRRFGTYEHERTGATLSRRGVDFATRPGRAVVAPADGTVRWAGPIRGLDAGVIIDHGGYTTVLAKLAELAVQPGATVRRGAPVGVAVRSRVYFEVRVPIGAAGLPVDPAPLLVAAPAAAE